MLVLMCTYVVSSSQLQVLYTCDYVGLHGEAAKAIALRSWALLSRDFVYPVRPIAG